MPSSWTALKRVRFQPPQRLRATCPAPARVPAEMSTPGTAAAYESTPDIASVRRVRPGPRAARETSDAVVQANQRAAPNVDTATRVAPRRGSGEIQPHAPPAAPAHDGQGGPRPHLNRDLPPLCRSLRSRSSRARWASTGRVAPASLTVRARRSRDQSWRTRLAPRGPPGRALQSRSNGRPPVRRSAWYRRRTAPAPTYRNRGHRDQEDHAGAILVPIRLSANTPRPARCRHPARPPPQAIAR